MSDTTYTHTVVATGSGDVLEQWHDVIHACHILEDGKPPESRDPARAAVIALEEEIIRLRALVTLREAHMTSYDLDVDAPEKVERVLRDVAYLYREWAKIANAVLKETGSESSAEPSCGLLDEQ